MSQSPIAIIGATSGVAQCVARQLATSGVEFYLVARNAEKLSQVAADLTARGATVHEVVAELADLNEHTSLLANIEAAEHYFIFHSSLTDQDAAKTDWQVAEDSLNVNLLSPLSLLHGLANTLEQSGSGSLVVVSSVAGDRGRASNYWYGTAKGALSIHCEGLRNRLMKAGVPLMTVKPGFIDTAMTAHIPKQPAILWASPETVAEQIIKGWQKNKDVIYTPGFWRWIMFIITRIPEAIFKRLSL